MLKAVLSESDYTSLAEPIKEHYEKTESGNYKLSTQVQEHPDTLALRNAYVTVKDEARDAKQKLTAFDGIDPNEITTLKREKELAQRDKDLSAGKFEKALNDGLTEVNQKLHNALKERDVALGKVRQLAINDAALRAISDVGGNSKLLLPHILSVADLDEKGRTVIKGDDGKPLMKREWRTADDFKPINEYVEDLKSDSDWAVAFKSNGARGSSAQPTTTTTTNNKVTMTDGANGSTVLRLG